MHLCQWALKIYIQSYTSFIHFPIKRFTWFHNTIINVCTTSHTKLHMLYKYVLCIYGMYCMIVSYIVYHAPIYYIPCLNCGQQGLKNIYAIRSLSWFQAITKNHDNIPLLLNESIMYRKIYITIQTMDKKYHKNPRKRLIKESSI